jgi:hypothetical protein
MFARLTSVTGSPERAKDARTIVSEQFVGKAREIPAIKGAYFMQAGDGRIFVLTLFESEAELEGSRANAEMVRGAAASALGESVVSVDELEVFSSF